MSFYKKRMIKNYDDTYGPRQKAIRFIDDNRETFSDYPENKLFMIDREDLRIYDYLNSDYETRCISIGFLLATLLTGRHAFKYRRDTRILLSPLMFFPVPISYGFAYYKLCEFLDYFQIKYKDRGLNDEDLWAYHKENSALRFFNK